MAVVGGLLGLRQPSVIGRWPDSNGMRKRRGCPAADNCWGLVDQLVILEGLYHETFIVRVPHVRENCHLILLELPATQICTLHPWQPKAGQTKHAPQGRTTAKYRVFLATASETLPRGNPARDAA